MAISIDWNTRVITVPISFLTLISGGGGEGSLYELDVNALRLALKDIEDSDEGMANEDTHRHATEVTIAGVTYARSFEIINGFTVTFEPLGGGAHYTVRCVGANHNISDVLNYNDVNLLIGNAAGLIVAGSGVTAGDVSDIVDAVLAALNATNIPVDVKKLNSATVIGTGTIGDDWRGVGVDPTP